MPTHADIASVNGVVTGYGRKFVSVEWCERGKQFIGAALLLYTNAGSSYVVAHLVAQGIELLGKSDLLWTGSATPQTLKQIGHDLVKLRQVVAPHLDSRILGTREVQQSLADLMRSSDDMRLDILTSLSIYSRLRKYRTAHHFFSRSDYGFD